MIYLLIKRKSCQEKRIIKTNLTGQVHRPVIHVLAFFPLSQLSSGRRWNNGSSSAGIFHHCGGQVLFGFTDGFVDQLEKVDLAAAQLMLAE
jgi:hypothetical protein